MGKVQFPFSRSFVLVLTNFSFCREGWALGYNSMPLLIIKHRFTCGEKKIWQNIKKSQNIMTRIVEAQGFDYI